MFMEVRTWWQQKTARYAFVLTIGWTAVVLLSLLWNDHAAHENNLEKARIEARTFYDLNLVYRRWVSQHGGVYVPVTDTFRPNPYLQVPDRDVTTTTGKKLTLVNPAWMTRQVFELLGKQSPVPIVSRLVSLGYLNPVNQPDAWEVEGLRSFERGVGEVDTLAMIGNEPYLRIMRPFLVEPSCLMCHADYRVGNVRGAISISVPLRHHVLSEARERRTFLASHLVMWLIGVGGILLFSRNLRIHQRHVTESAQTYRLLFDRNPHPMWVYDIETLRFLAVNEEAVRHYGYSREEFLTMTIKDLRPAEDVPSLMDNLAHQTAGLDKAGVWRHRKKDGTVIHAEITFHVVDFGGRRAKIVLANDVTDRMKLEDQLRHAQKMEAVGLLAGGVAHDFNNVLTAIIGYGNLIQMKLPPDDPLRNYAENIKVTAQRAAQLTQNLLAFSRKQVIHPAPVELNSVVRRIDKLLKRLIREDIELRTLLTDRDTTILADSVQIEQALMNLITNARDAMPDGGVLTVRSEIVVLDAEAVAGRGYRRPGPHVLLTVSDTGAGMDERTRERVFEPFFTTKEMGKGTGLGLATVYGIVKQHQGFTEVESAPGRGTSILVYLPLAPAPGSAGTKPASPEIRGGDETILISEDDEPIRALTRSVLAEFGYTVIEAADGEEAVRLFREQGDRVHLLLFDVIMPKKNGRAAFEEIRRVRPDIKVLFISGYSSDMVDREGVLEQGLHFISKPLSPTELLQKVREVLDS